MSFKAVLTGQFNLVDESTGLPKSTVDLSKLNDIVGILEKTDNIRQITSADGVVSIDKGGVGTIRGMLIQITGGTGPITLKHDGNVNGLVIDQFMLVYGTLDTITIETASTQTVTVSYVFFE